MKSNCCRIPTASRDKLNKALDELKFLKTTITVAATTLAMRISGWKWRSGARRNAGRYVAVRRRFFSFR